MQAAQSVAEHNNNFSASNYDSKLIHVVLMLL